MSRRAVLGLVLTGVGGGAVIYGSGAYDAIEGHRSFNVGVSDDDDAFLGISITESGGNTGERIITLELTNQFSEPLDDVSIDVLELGSFTLQGTDVPDVIEPGSTAVATIELLCSGSTSSEEVVLHITVGGSQLSESVTAAREITVNCDHEEVSHPSFESVTFDARKLNWTIAVPDGVNLDDYRIEATHERQGAPEDEVYTKNPAVSDGTFEFESAAGGYTIKLIENANDEVVDQETEDPPGYGPFDDPSG